MCGCDQECLLIPIFNFFFLTFFFFLQIFLVISTILWVVSGALIHQMWGYVECENAGVASSLAEFESQVEGGLSLCHEIKIIEIIAWVIAGLSVVATVPVVKTYLQRRRSRRQGRAGELAEKGDGRDGAV